MFDYMGHEIQVGDLVTTLLTAPGARLTLARIRSIRVHQRPEGDRAIATVDMIEIDDIWTSYSNVFAFYSSEHRDTALSHLRELFYPEVKS